MGNLGSGYMFFKVEAQRVREPGPDFHTIMSIKNDGHYSHGTGRKRTDGLKKPLTKKERAFAFGTVNVEGQLLRDVIFIQRVQREYQGQ